MLRFIWTTTGHVFAFVWPWMPSNIILEATRTRRGLKWGILATLLAVPHFALAYWCTVLIDDGSPKALYLIVLVCICSGIKFVIIGIVSLLKLLRIHSVEACLNRTPRYDRR